MHSQGSKDQIHQVVKVTTAGSMLSELNKQREFLAEKEKLLRGTKYSQHVHPRFLATQATDRKVASEMTDRKLSKPSNISN